MMKTVILAEKPSQAKAYADSFSKATRKDGYFEIQDRLFPGETVITYGFGHLVELDSPDMYDENWKQWSLEHLPIFPTRRSSDLSQFHQETIDLGFQNTRLFEWL